MRQLHVTVVVGSPSENSRTRVLALAIADAIAAAVPVAVQVLEIARLAPHIGVSVNPADLSAEGKSALRAIETADLVIAASPVYKGSYSGLFKHLFDLVDPNALVGRLVLLAATGGSDRHALAVDHQLRPLFAFFRALTVPSAVYATEADFDGGAIGSPALKARIEEAVGQAVGLLRAAADPLLAAA